METFVALKYVSTLFGNCESGNLMRQHNQEESIHNSICTCQGRALCIWDRVVFQYLRPFTKYLRLTLVSIWNSALREKFNFCFQQFFSSIDKIIILTGRLGTRLSLYEV